ncbi:MAG: diphosphomevalonate decarboxylase [Erysipelothrix sp.]|nr:diphosphomevalonate decarboxylase [Erysipelothrix sp.]
MGTVKAHANIALIKYWGKEDENLFLPSTSSLSMTLDALHTITTVQLSTSDSDLFILNDQIQSSEETSKVSRFVDLFRKDNQKVIINSTNNFPTAAGLASSASGYAALSLALNYEFDHQLSLRDLSKLTRRGSGSASRSLYGGFVKWTKGNNDTSVATPIDSELEMEMIIVIVNAEKKTGGSRAMMKKTKEQSRYFDSWLSYNDRDLQEMEAAIIHGDLNQVGRLAERNAMMMHATMLAIDEPFFYLQPDSLRVIQIVKECREQGLLAYYTMDAGPNVKIITTPKDREAILKHLGDFRTIVAKKGPGAQLI